MNYRLGIYEKAMPADLSWKERMEAAGKAGFDFVEISIDETDARLERLKSPISFRRELRALGEETGTPIETMCLIEARSLEIMQDAITFAKDVGIRIIQLAGYDVYYDETPSPETRARFIRNLAKSGVMAAEHGIILALETMENDFCNTATKALDFVKAVNSPFVKIYPDVGNIRNGTEDPLGDLKNAEGNIVAAHLKETKEGIFRDLFYGEGRVDMEGSVNTLYSMGVRRYNAEFWHDGGENWRERLSAANDYLRKYLDKEVGAE